MNVLWKAVDTGSENRSCRSQIYVPVDSCMCGRVGRTVSGRTHSPYYKGFPLSRATQGEMTSIIRLAVQELRAAGMGQSIHMIYKWHHTAAIHYVRTGLSTSPSLAAGQRECHSPEVEIHECPA